MPGGSWIELRYSVTLGKRFWKRAWLFAAVFILAIALFATLAPPNRPPFDFITKLEGKQVPDPDPIPIVDIPYPDLEHERTSCFYVFKGDPEQVWKEIDIEMRRRDWEPSIRWQEFSDPVSGGWLRFHDTTSYTLPPGYSCMVLYVRESSWLERQWATVRGWFGG